MHGENPQNKSVLGAHFLEQTATVTVGEVLATDNCSRGLMLEPGLATRLRHKRAMTDLVAISTPVHALSLLNEIRQALAECNDLEDVQELRNQAEVIRRYLKSAAANLEVLNRAAILKLLCEHRAGTILKDLVKRGGDRKTNKYLAKSQLEELGIKNNMQSSRLQAVASISEEDFWRYVNQAVHEKKEVTTNALLRFAQLHSERTRAAHNGDKALASVSNGLISLARQGKQFCCIYASPCWDSSRRGGIGALPGALSELPVKAVAASNAHIHLAVRPELIKAGIALLDKWGFRFRGELVCRTLPPEFGDHWQRAHTSLLLGVRGKLVFRDTGLPSWLDDKDIFGNNGAVEIHALIARASPPPYLDLLADKTVREWISPRAPK